MIKNTCQVCGEPTNTELTICDRCAAELEQEQRDEDDQHDPPATAPLTFISLFAGIGGMDLGLERAGLCCVAQVEIDDYATKVLQKHWPDVIRRRDVRDVGAHNLPHADLICGGFPCQDISYAGRGAGLAGARSGLWYEFARIVGEIRPRYVLVENVAALLTRGLPDVLGTLASFGYDAEWHCLPAATVGAPHLRERIFILAHHRVQRIQRIIAQPIPQFAAFSWRENVRRVEDLRGRSDIPQPLFRGSSDGIPHWVDRLRGLGNAVVPPVAQYIGEQIIRFDKEHGREAHTTV